MFETSQAGFAADTPCPLFHEAVFRGKNCGSTIANDRSA
jgi:hypothetical protein